MKKRYLYSILCGVPGFFVSLVISFTAFGAVAGFLWLYVLGDNPWPSSAESILPVLFLLAFLALWIATVAAGFIAGKRLETTPGLDRKHVLFSLGATILPIVLIFLHQLSVGNIGAKTDSQICGEICVEKGYAASGMPPKNTGIRVCSCYDNDGSEVYQFKLDTVISDKQG